MAKSLVFKTSLDDTDFANGLKRMETSAAVTGRKAGEALNEGMSHGAGPKGGLRMYGDALNAITGQTGGVMKLNGLVHGLGLSLGYALAGVGGYFLGKELFEDSERAKELHNELNKIAGMRMGSSFATTGELTKNLEQAQTIKEEFEARAGDKPGQSTPSRFINSLKSQLADIGDIFQSVPEGGHWLSHQEKDRNASEEAQKMQQDSADNIAEKMQMQLDILKLQKSGNIELAALKKEEMETDERIGEIARQGLKYGVDVEKQAAKELELSQERQKVIHETVAERGRKMSIANAAGQFSDNEKAMKINLETNEKRREELLKHLTTRQADNLSIKDIISTLAYQDSTNPSELAKAENRAKINGDITNIRERAAQQSGMSSLQINNQNRAEMRAAHAADRAERKALMHLPKEQREAAKTAMHAAKNAVSAKIDPQDLTNLANAIATQIALLVPH